MADLQIQVDMEDNNPAQTAGESATGHLATNSNAIAILHSKLEAVVSVFGRPSSWQVFCLFSKI